MTTLYKLTDRNGNTHNFVHWKVGITHSIINQCNNPRLCSEDVFHAYKNINLAFLLNPLHANILNPLLWQVSGKIVVEDFGKVGCFSLKVIQQLPIPNWVHSNKKHDVQLLFTILCAEKVLYLFKNKYPNDNRPQKAIEDAIKYLRLHTKDAAKDAHDAAIRAQAASTVASTAHDIYASNAAQTAALTAFTAHATSNLIDAYAARTASAASNADFETKNIDFGKLADSAVKMIME